MNTTTVSSPPVPNCFPVADHLSDQDQAAPHFLGLNFHGNHTIAADPRIIMPEPGLDSDGIANRVAEVQGRGSSASRWPIELILAEGFWVATCYAGEIDPDYPDDFQNGFHPLFYRPDQHRPEFHE